MRSIVIAPDDQILRVLSIAHEHSTIRGGRGLSLRDLIDETNYRALGTCISVAQLVAVLREKPEIVDDWLAYSGDKRTSYGYGFGSSSAGAWTVDGPNGYCEQFATPCDGCAEFVLRELDFWVAIEDSRTRRST